MAATTAMTGLNSYFKIFLAWLLSPLLLLQAVWVKKRTPRLDEAAGAREGSAGKGASFKLLAVGDSIIAGVGVQAMEQALPAQLALSLSEIMKRRVCWFSHGVNGARTRDLLEWVAASGEQQVDLLLVSNGLNDVTSSMSLKQWLEDKGDLYTRLRRMAPEAHIAQLGLPPLGHFPALPNPLRVFLGMRSRSFDLALEALIESRPGIVHLPFTEIPEASQFAVDGYHPGPAAVKIWAASLATDLATDLIGVLAEQVSTGPDSLES
jgi:lysophospholipase L1-like esterase